MRRHTREIRARPPGRNFGTAARSLAESTKPALGTLNDVTQSNKRRSIVDVLDLLKQDHQKVSRLIEMVQQAEPDDDNLRETADQIVQELTIHSQLEESMFYPLLRDRAEEAEERIDVFEAFTEHDVVKHLISLLGGRQREPELFKAELQVLGENVKHHVREEESTIFALARELLDDDEREELGEQVQAQKEKMMRSPRSGGRKKSSRTTTRGGRKKASASSSGSRKKTATRKKTTTRKGGRRKTRR
jgi:hemerythrin superfamily protein